MATPRYVEESFDIPQFTHLSDAENFLARVAALVAGGQLDLQTGLELSSLAKAWLDAQYAREELAIKQYNAGSTDREQVIRVEGGLPVMPGLEDVVMPQLNGHVHDVLAPPVPQIESSSLGKESNGHGSPTTDTPASCPQDQET